MNKRSDSGWQESKFNPAYCAQGHKLALLGLTDEQLAEFFEVSRSTLSQWKLDHPEFAAALRSGKMMADAEVAKSLYQRATGYRSIDYHFATIKGKLVHKRYVKHYPPEVMAGMYWLNNRQRAIWKTRQDHHHTVLTEDLVRAIELGMFTDDELEQISAGKLTKDIIARVSSAARVAADTSESGT